jgi:hypothetical protein
MKERNVWSQFQKDSRFETSGKAYLYAGQFFAGTALSQVSLLMIDKG